MPLDASTIAKYRQAVASKDRQAALQYISALHPKETVPVIIAIIQDALAKLPVEGESGETRAFFIYARDLLMDLHVKQNASLIKLPSILKEYTKDRITRELTELISKVDSIKMNAALIDISKEAEIWLEGWYLHTFNMVTKDKNGNPQKDESGAYKRIDTEDSIFYKVVGMTKIEIAMHYGKVAASLRAKIHGYQDEIVQKPIKQEVQESSLPKIEVMIKDGLAIISASVSALDTAIIERIKNAINSAALPNATPMQPKVNNVAVVDETDLATFLKYYSSDNNDIKIQVLENVINQYGLTDAQKKVLANLKANIIAKLDSYANDPYVLPLTKIPLPGGIFNRAHKQFVDEKKNEIFSTTDPKELLKILFDMRTTLIGRCSDDLLRKVNTLILDAYTMLERVPQARMGARVSCGF